MVRRVSVSQFNSMLRQAEQKRRQAIDQLNRDLRNRQQKLNQFVTAYNPRGQRAQRARSSQPAAAQERACAAQPTNGADSLRNVSGVSDGRSYGLRAIRAIRQQRARSALRRLSRSLGAGGRQQRATDECVDRQDGHLCSRCRRLA